jgi:aldose 1-epimerase
LTDENELKINYEAITTKSTILNPTHHSYFNLTGDFTRSILEHELQIDANNFTPIDQDLIPTGVVESVENTPMDFRTMKPIGLNLNNGCNQLKYGKGFDHNWVLNNYIGQVEKFLHYMIHLRKINDLFTDQPDFNFIQVILWMEKSSVRVESILNPGPGYVWKHNTIQILQIIHPFHLRY